MGHTKEKAKTYVVGKGNFPSVQDMFFIRDSLSCYLEEIRVPPHSIVLTFSHEISSAAIMQFVQPNNIEVIVKRPNGRHWNKDETLRALGLLPHEIAHLRQTKLTEELKRKDQWSCVWLEPKFLREGYAMMHEKFSTTQVLDKTIITQSPLSRVLKLINKNFPKTAYTHGKFKEYLLGSQLESYQRAFKSLDNPILGTAKYLEHHLAYLALCGLRTDISPEELVDAMLDKSKLNILNISPSTRISRDLVSPWNISVYPDQVQQEAYIIEDTLQKLYYADDRLNATARLAYENRDRLRDNGLTLEVLGPEVLPIIELNRDIMSRLIPQSKSISDLINYATSLSEHFFEWGKSEYQKLS